MEKPKALYNWVKVRSELVEQSLKFYVMLLGLRLSSFKFTIWLTNDFENEKIKNINLIIIPNSSEPSRSTSGDACNHLFFHRFNSFKNNLFFSGKLTIAVGSFY